MCRIKIHDEGGGGGIGRRLISRRYDYGLFSVFKCFNLDKETAEHALERSPLKQRYVPRTIGALSSVCVSLSPTIRVRHAHRSESKDVTSLDLSIINECHFRDNR